MLNSQAALTSGVFCAQPWTIICHLLWATAKIPWKLDFGILMESCRLERWQRKLREYSHFNASQLLLYFLVQWHHPHCKTEKPPLKKERKQLLTNMLTFKTCHTHKMRQAKMRSSKPNQFAWDDWKNKTAMGGNVNTDQENDETRLRRESWQVLWLTTLDFDKMGPLAGTHLHLAIRCNPRVH